MPQEYRIVSWSKKLKMSLREHIVSCWNIHLQTYSYTNISKFSFSQNLLLQVFNETSIWLPLCSSFSIIVLGVKLHPQPEISYRSCGSLKIDGIIKYLVRCLQATQFDPVPKYFDDSSTYFHGNHEKMQTIIDQLCMKLYHLGKKILFLSSESTITHKIFYINSSFHVK